MDIPKISFSIDLKKTALYVDARAIAYQAWQLSFVIKKLQAHTNLYANCGVKWKIAINKDTSEALGSRDNDDSL